MSFPDEKIADEKIADEKIADGNPIYSDSKRKESFAAKVQRQLSVTSLNDDESTKEGQLFSMVEIDPALDAKMHIVNNVCARQTLFPKNLSD